MARRPPIDDLAQQDSTTLHEAIQAVIDGHGRGGLSYVAEKLGVTPSMLRKRLLVPGRAFDAPTLRAVALIIEIQNEQQAEAQPPEQS